MFVFLRGALWSAAVILATALVWSWVDGSAVVAQAPTDDTPVSIEDEPYAYWKCWRTGTSVGYGFTAGPKTIGNSTAAVPYMPDVDALREQGLLLTADGTGDGRLHYDRSSLLSARFYRSPGLRAPDYKPLAPGNSGAFKPLVNPSDPTKTSKYFLDPTDALPHWNPWVMEADGRISKLEITWDTHAGVAGEGAIDEVLRAQQEQSADAETAEHLVHRQGAYRGSGSASGGVLDAHAPVHEQGTLGSASPGVGYRVETGYQEDQVMVMSGTSYTSSSGSNTTTTYNISSSPRNVSNEISVTNRNSAQHPEVNTAQVSVQEAVPELMQVGYTDHHDNSAAAAPKPGDAALENGAVRIKPGYQVVMTTDATPRPACYVAGTTERYRSTGSSRQYRAYCWMVRTGAVATATGTPQTLSVPSALPDGMEHPITDSSGSLGSTYGYMASVTTPFTVPVYGISPQPGENDGVLDANTPGERRDALDPLEAADGPNDALIVAIDLKTDHRRDPDTNYSVLDGSGENDYRWSLFGQETVRPRMHLFSNGVLRQVGYEQSYLVPSFFGGGSDDKKKQEVILPYLYDHRGGVEKYGLDSVFVWPVRLDEMNYYLFRVPDFTHGHQLDRGHIMNLAYAHSSGVIQSSLNVEIAGLTITWAEQPRGQAVAVPVEVAGTSGRTDFGVTAHHVNPFTDGKIYYPFFDHDSYTAAVTDASGYGGANPVAGAGAYGYASGAKGLVLSRDMLVKAGVTAPLDRAESADAYGNNATFRFQIDEGVPAPAADGGSRADLLNRLGFSPSYLSEVHDGSDPLESAWPNERIDPDDAHLLVVTFYEGRLGGKWRIQRVIDVPFTDGVGLPEQVEEARQKLAEGAANAGAAVTGFFSGKASDKVRDLAPDLGSVPRFQYRRVMCRILVPADGVVVPASGWEGVKDKLGDVMHGIVGALTGVLDKLIAWLESVPLGMIEMTARMSAEATCTGAELMDDMGELSSADRQIASSPPGADVSISSAEFNSRMGERSCEEVSDDAVTLDPDCSDAARAVGDPACTGVPSVDFRSWRVSAGPGGVSYLSTSGRDGIDERYVARWVPRHRDDYEQVQLVTSAHGDRLGKDVQVDELVDSAIDLKDSVAADWGVGAVRVDFDYDNLDLLYGGTVDIWSRLGTVHAPHDGDVNWDNKDYSRFMADRNGARFDGYILYVRPDPKVAGFHTGDRASLNTLLTAKQQDEIPQAKLGAGGYVGLGLTPDEQRFVLPLYYLQYGLPDFSTNVTVRRVEGFDMGTVLRHDANDDADDCFESHVPILARRPYVDSIGEDLGQGFPRLDNTGAPDTSDRFRCRASDNDLWAMGNNNQVVFVGRSDWGYLEGYLKNLWYLGDGFRYQFALSAYRGMPGVDDSWVEGPRSPWLTITGGAELACRDRFVRAAGWQNVDERYFAEANSGYESKDWDGDGDTESASEYYREVYHRYSCEGMLGPGRPLEHLGAGSEYNRALETGYSNWLQSVDPIATPRLEPDAGRGVLGAQMAPDLSGIYGSTNLLGSQVCGNFWNGTPPSRTWDSPLTRAVWHISWVLALLVLFVLLLCDGLSLTYNGMLSDSRGSVTLRTILPRFALALLLAAASLLICRVVLTLASDVTCYVSHATGMTFWGFLGTIVLPAMVGLLRVLVTPFAIAAGTAGVGSAAAVAASAPIVAAVGFKAMIVVGIVFTVFLLIMLWYLGKVLIGMVMRILLLMILAGLSPVAMAMYASPSTEHWTKKWVSLFLGAAFQQVVVLMVLFCGATIGMSLLDWNRPEGMGSWAHIGMIFLDVLLVIFTLFLAARVPDLINPGGKGLFSGLGQALMIAGAAAAVIATAGAGAIGGAFAGSGAAGSAGGSAGGGGGFLGGMGNRIGSMFGGGGGTNAASNMVGAAGQPGQQAVTNSMANMQANASGIGSQPSLPGMGGGQSEAGTAAGAGGEGAGTASGGTGLPSTDGAAGSVRPQGRSETGAAAATGEAPAGATGEASPGSAATGGPVAGAPEAPSDTGEPASTGDGDQTAAAGTQTGGGFGGWLSRVGRGAHHGAAQGQRYARMIQTYGRGNFGAPPDRGRSRAARVDVQGFRNYVRNVDPQTDTAMQAEVEQRRREGGMGPMYMGRRGVPDNEGENEGQWGNAGSDHQDND